MDMQYSNSTSELQNIEKTIGRLPTASELRSMQKDHLIKYLIEIEGERQVAERSLRERVKELICLYGISKIAETPNIPIRVILLATLDLIPSAWQYPEICCASIQYGEEVYQADRCRETEWKLSTSIEVNRKLLQINVYYSEGKPFLREEEYLLQDIGIRLKNIIERIETEKTLRSSAQKFRTIFEAIPDLFFLCSSDFIILEYKGNKKELYTPPEVFLGKRISEVMPLELVKKIEEKIRKALKTQTYQILEYTLLITTQQKYYEARFLPFSDREVAVFCRDITERQLSEAKLKESEEKYRTLILNASDIITEVDSKGNMLYVSPQVTEILGYTPSELIRMNSLDIIHPDDLRRVAEKLRDGFTASGQTVLFDYRVQHKDGHYIYMSAHGSFNIEANRFIAILRDITMQKKAEQQLKESEERYRILSESLEQEVAERTEALVQSRKLASVGELSAGIAHEINNPLMGIMNYAGIIRDELETMIKNCELKCGMINLEKKPLVFLTRIIEESQRIATIAEGLMVFARQRKSIFNNGNIIEVINSTLLLLHLEFIRDRIVVQTNYPEEPFPQIQMDAARLRQVFLNVLKNSIDALNSKEWLTKPEVKKTISVQALVINRQENRCIELIFRDNGVGIPQESIEKVMEPFYSTKHTGTGLGLSISYGIIKEHNGEIQIKSILGKETVVEIMLPLKRDFQKFS